MRSTGSGGLCIYKGNRLREHSQEVLNFDSGCEIERDTKEKKLLDGSEVRACLVVFDFDYSIFQKNSTSSRTRGCWERRWTWVFPRYPAFPNIIRELLAFAVGSLSDDVWHPDLARGERNRAAVGGKKKNKLDQSQGGSYRCGYGFRKRPRILFLRKPDKKLLQLLLLGF